MAQFDVYTNENPATKKITPYLLDVQADLFEFFSTRVIVPLTLASKIHITSKHLTPILEIEKTKLVMLTPQIAGASNKLLKKKITNLKNQRDVIIAALDLLFTGF